MTRENIVFYLVGVMIEREVLVLLYTAITRMAQSRSTPVDAVIETLATSAFQIVSKQLNNRQKISHAAILERLRLNFRFGRTWNELQDMFRPGIILLGDPWQHHYPNKSQDAAYPETCSNLK
jgi:hypothetical protein